MSTNAGTSKLARPTPFTPKRPVGAGTSMERLTRATVTPAPHLLASTHKKYKAPISSDVRNRTHLRTNSSKPTTLAPVPGSRPSSPTKSDNGRPRTPGTPRRGTTPDPSMARTSEMDVTNVDPEEVLVDYQNVEPADVSLGEMDEAWLKTMQADHGKEDKVMVSVRVKPDSKSAWKPSVSTNTIELNPAHARQPTSFTFDAILTGSANKPIFTTVARSHVVAAMEGFNAVIFAYGQTASGKTYTLSGSEVEPGIIPRAMRQVFSYIRRTETREYLLRCSYLEIYNEQIHDLLAPPGVPNKVELQGGTANGDIILAPLREEVVTSIKGVQDVLKRGESHRRTACTDWNERSSRSHSIFRLVIESRERVDTSNSSSPSPVGGRATPSGRQTPGPGGNHGGPRLQSRDGRSVQTSVLSLIDLAGSEKATSDKERTREGKYINTSLLTLGSVIGKLSDNATKHKNDHIPFRDSKLTRLLQPSLSGNARISVICTINPDPSAVAESTSTLLFAKRVKGVKLHAQKKEIIDTDALIERYRKEIDDLKRRLEEKENMLDDGKEEKEKVSMKKRRMSAQEKADESQAMQDLQSRIQQLTKLILTSQTVTDEAAGGPPGESRPVSPIKVDFDMSPYQLQQELLTARLQLSSQETQILSLEAALEAARAVDSSVPSDAGDKDKTIQDQAKTIEEQAKKIRELENARFTREPSPSRVDLDREQKDWSSRLDEEKKKREEKERWAEELVRQLEKEKWIRTKLEDERRALAAFVSKFDSLGMGTSLTSATSATSLSSVVASAPKPGLPTEEGDISIQITGVGNFGDPNLSSSALSPLRLPEGHIYAGVPSLLEQMPEEAWVLGDVSFDDESISMAGTEEKVPSVAGGMKSHVKGSGTVRFSTSVDIMGGKENVGPC
ncbi:P-loop containing nucleoside triphosphate hydrolase protein [Lentinula aff. lateritia]|uniref:P-loop containing nucleoside triphosphate hydrolase protein n=1 Tax=Lentinula aff. lateritia TaxID=2804960 RepID=A0ACC1U3R7_9AGAR|nr:P-loop containing nucleoside triphosphate hydrolase protein [Lentinula aff. lateritia]